MDMSRILSFLSFAFICGLFSTPSLAILHSSGPTLVGTPTDASGINGVVVNGVTYDATFSMSSFGSFFDTAGLANAASMALAADLNTLSVTGLNFGGASGFNCAATVGIGYCAIWAGSSSQLDAVANDSSPGITWFGGFSTGGLLPVSPVCPHTLPGGSSGCFEAAVWTKVSSGSVPEPATLALLGLGLVGLGLSRRRLAR